MPSNDLEKPDYKSLDSPKKGGGNTGNEQQTLSPPKKNQAKEDETFDDSSLKGPNRQETSEELPNQTIDTNGISLGAEVSSLKSEKEEAPNDAEPVSDILANDSLIPDEEPEEVSYSEKAKQKRQEKRKAKDEELLDKDNWLVRSGHNLTYAGLYFFSFLVFFRPYETIPGLGSLTATAFPVAFATLAVYIPTQLSTEGNLTVMSTEIKCVIVLTALALLTIPIARDPGLAWETFNDNFIKAALMFVVMVNVLRTRKRLLGIVWLALAIAVYLSYMSWSKYSLGEFSVEGYRIEVDIGGMFANPNDMALHLVMMFPIAIALGLASKSILPRAVYLSMAALFIVGNMVTFSRGGFLGLMAASGVLAWKLGRKYRLNVTLASIVVGGLALLLAPGNYGLRILSIFIPGLDPVGSRGQRSDLLWQSLLVTGRNPWGIGMGNFNIGSIRHLGTHNAYTQVSAELGVLGLLAYIIFLVSPLRKLGAIERTQVLKDKTDWFYYLSIGLQASIVGYMVSSFFAAVAFNWYIYYLIAYAVAFRRIYMIEHTLDEIETVPLSEGLFGWQIKST